MRSVTLALFLGMWVRSPLFAEEPQAVELTIHASAIESPVLKYRLLPSEAELKPGNAVPILLRLPWENTAYINKVYPTLKEWDARPLTDPKWQEFRGVLPFFDEMKRAAFRREASWEYPIGEEPASFIMLPDVNGLRTLLGHGLSAEIRHSLMRGELDQAREQIMVGLANARHLARTPFFVNQLVAAAVDRSMLDRTGDLIAQAESPNLYWALSTLPDSLVELHRAASLESSVFALTFPAATDLDRPRESHEWKRMLDQLIALLSGLGDTRPLDANESELRRREMVQIARNELASLLQIPAEKVAAMSDDEAAIRWYVRVRANLDQKACAILCLKPLEAWPLLREFNAEVKAVQRKCKDYPLEFFDPASVYLPVWSLRRQVDMLRVIEAVRNYLATHDGKLPATLAEIDAVPVPKDALSDEPFEWTVNGSTATLKSLFVPAQLKTKYPFDGRFSFRLVVK